MADINLQSGFFNAVMVDGSPDRTYNADSVNKFFEGLVSENGIFETVSTACQVVESSGMNVVVKAGKGIVSSHWFYIVSDTSLSIANSDVILNRIDAIVVRMDLNTRTIVLTVKQGTLATNPVAPTLTRTDEVYEIALAYVTVNKNVTSINNSMITDTRSNNNLCGWIVGLIKQMDTTTLFNQYQSAQDNFINEQTEAFNTWFEENQTTLKATSLYREYSTKYKTVLENESTFTIPTSIQYTNGMDVLNIFINGFKIGEDEFSINTAGTQITLTYPLDRAGTEIEFVNKKCVEGTVAESTVSRVEELETKVNALTNLDYNCSGTDDNISISNIVKSFLNGTGDYSGVNEHASLYISVVGNLGITNLIDSSYVFDFNSSVSSNRKIYIDFSRATIPTLAFSATTLAVFSSIENVSILNANVQVTYSVSGTLYGFHGGKAKDCKLNIQGSTSTQAIYGGWACDEVNNCEIILSGVTDSSNKYGLYSCTKAITNTIEMSVGTSIRASGKQLLLGNFVNQSVSVDSTVTNIGTVTI